MKKFTIALIVIFALLVVGGVVSIFTTTLGNYEFSNGWNVTVYNSMLTNQQFTDYVTEVDEFMTANKIKSVNRQLLGEDDGLINAVSYDFYMFSEEQKAQFTAKLGENNAIKYMSTGIVNTTAVRNLIFAAIAAVVVLAIQFLYYVIFQKKANGVRNGLIATLFSVVTIVTAIAVSLLLALIGVKYSPDSTLAILLALFVSVMMNIMVTDKARANLNISHNYADANERTQQFINKTLLVFCAPVLVACVVIAAVFTTKMLAFAVPLAFGLVAAYLAQGHFVLPMLLKTKTINQPSL